jgi:hypothetical protein
MPATRREQLRNVRRMKIELADFLAANPRAFMCEIAEHFGVHRGSVWRALKAIQPIAQRSTSTAPAPAPAPAVALAPTPRRYEDDGAVGFVSVSDRTLSPFRRPRIKS